MPSKIKAMRLRAIAFTLNNYGPEDLDAIKDSGLYKYGVIGREVGDKGTPHLQGYVQLAKQTAAKKAYRMLAALCSNHPHMGKAIKEPEVNRKYCSKDGDFVEWGVAPQPRRRTDLHEMHDAIIGGADWLTLAKDFTNTHARYYKWGERLAEKHKCSEAKIALKAKMSEETLRPWQTNALALLAKQSDREVLWIMDSTGGKGKTFLAKWLCVVQDAFYVEGGKKADISYAYAFQDTVVFDLCRGTEEFVNYGTIESFKNGMMFSPKFHSTMKVFEPAKVVVFSNWAPDTSKLSADRWNIIDLDRKSMHEQVRSAHISSDFIFTDDTIARQ